jgi:hypothetical protein
MPIGGTQECGRPNKFLKEVWNVGDLTGRQLFPSRGERELSSAMIDDTPDVVAIAAAQ